MITALFKIIFGFGLVVGGIILEGMWLAFCFGTVVIGIVLLIWFTPILFFPFAVVSLPGWRMVQEGMAGLNPLNVKAVASELRKIIQPQIVEVQSLGIHVPLNKDVMTYIAALTFVARAGNLSLVQVIEITTALFKDSQHRLSIENLRFCVDYSDNLKSFWDQSRMMVPRARQELALGQGRFLVELATSEARAL